MTNQGQGKAPTSMFPQPMGHIRSVEYQWEKQLETTTACWYCCSSTHCSAYKPYFAKPMLPSSSSCTF